MSSKNHPSIDLLRQCFRCEDGKLFWLCRPRDHFPDERVWKMWNTSWAGKEAGGLSGGRHMVNLNGKRLYRHRIIWAFHHEDWPAEIDHKNRCPLDDRIENLRIASHSQNLANRGPTKSNTSGYKGVSWSRVAKKWVAQIKLDYHRIHLGYFDDPIEAHQAYMVAATKGSGEFACGE